VEFAYNNTVHTSTSKAPFEIIYGKVVLPPILRTKNGIFAANEYVRDLDTAFAQVRTAIERSQTKHKKTTNKYRREVQLKEGDWVLLKFEKHSFGRSQGKRESILSFPKGTMDPFRSWRRSMMLHFALYSQIIGRCIMLFM